MSASTATTTKTAATTLETTASMLTTGTKAATNIWYFFCQPILLSKKLVMANIAPPAPITSNPIPSLNFIEREKHGLIKKRATNKWD